MCRQGFIGARQTSGKSTLWTNTGQDWNFQRTLSVIGPYEFRGKFIWTNHWSIPFPGGNSYGPMVLKVFLKFPPTLVLVHGWLFPERGPTKSNRSQDPKHYCSLLRRALLLCCHYCSLQQLQELEVSAVLRLLPRRRHRQPLSDLQTSTTQQTRVHPHPLGAGSARPNPKMGAPDPESQTSARNFPEIKFNLDLPGSHGLDPVVADPV